MHDENPPPKEFDLYRDTPLRYLGYANELGEAFRTIIGRRMVRGTYGIAITYVLADTISKTKQEYEQQTSFKNVAFVGMDTILWQMLASVIIPGITINRTCAFFYNRLHGLSTPVRKFAVAGIGIVTIPIIIKPIDHMVDSLMDRTLRKFSPS
ncbi:hypothetical protein RN001_010797 [Aquatica leii]|uniref:Mitochondrial fission process protein 1 n=1 Tax=Aquatica leii TaxID=1421715 RepID=A0AAN7PA75_9COLE|nr:hypothetical protein RN001_010797 [Aquatica leii]